MQHHDQFYAHGQWHPCSSGESVPVVDPSTDQTIAQVALCSVADVDTAVRAAGEGFRAWAGSSLEQRRAVLVRLAAALERREAEMVRSFASETGCPIATGRFVQGLMVRTGLAAVIEGIDQVRWEEPVRHSLVRRVPVGVVAGITAWNAPVFQMMAKAAAAIAAGCAIVLKPSEAAPDSARLFCEAVAECGLPPGVVNLVWGGPAVGEALVTHPGIAQVSFTGSPEIGRRIMASAARGLKRVVLELGGKSAAVLLDDADFGLALPAALRACMVHSGQICAAQSRLIVPRARLAEVRKALLDQLPAYAPGDPHDEATRLGPLASAAQFTRVHRMVSAALDEGAALLAGGPGRAPGFSAGQYVRPTVLEALPEMVVAREEVFGPVLCLIAHDGDDDAVRITNGTAYGLSGALWSADPARARAVASRMHTGQVVVNGAAQNLAAPFGGVGASGFGRENGRFGIESFLDHQNLQGVA
ncbi:MAG: aldehyde dehydrogenase family protein [Vitreoscilla sp.]|nr:aldehyde dehydrogenase family protein [Vitreoscilla sp.]